MKKQQPKYRIKDLKGKFNCTSYVTGGGQDFCVGVDWTVDNIPKIIKAAEKAAADRGGHIEVDGVESITYVSKDAKTVTKTQLPRLPHIRVGTIEFRSKDYVLRYHDADGEPVESYGDKPRATQLIPGGFIVRGIRGMTIKYYIERAEA